MISPKQDDISLWGAPNRTRADSFPTVSPMSASYEDLHRLARFLMRGESNGHLLQTTALVHQAYLRLAMDREWQPKDARHLILSAARAMRAVLVDHARWRKAQRRGRDHARVPLDDVVDAHERHAVDLVALDEALDRLGALDTELQQVVELRFYSGLNESEIASIIGKSTRTVRRAWRVAKLWLRRELTHD